MGCAQVRRDAASAWQCLLALPVLTLFLCGCQPQGEHPALAESVAAGAPVPASVQQAASPIPVLSPGAMYARLRGAKRASSLLERSGGDFEAALSQRVTAAGAAARFDSAWVDGYSSASALAYAAYRFDLTARVGRIKMNTQWSHPPATPPFDYSKVWLGASNWQRDRWDWYSGAVGGAALTAAGSLDSYRHAQTGEMLVVVVLLAKASTEIERVWLDGFSMRGDWWMDGRNAQRGACSVAIGPAYPSLSWSLPIGCSTTPIYDANGVIYIFAGASDELWLTAVSPAGQLLWTKPIAAAPEGSNCAAALGDDGTVYCAFGDMLYACTPDGALLWDFPLNGWLTLGLAIASDGTLHADVAAADSSVHHYAVRPDGTLLWDFHQQGASPTYASAISLTGEVYCPTNQGLKSFAPDGAVKWTYSFDTPYCSSPCIAPNGTVYVNDFNEQKLCAIQPDGTLAWSVVIAGSPAGSPSLGPSGEILVWDQTGGLNSFSSAGALQWRHQFSVGWGDVWHPLATDRTGTSFFLGGDALLMAINNEGALSWWRETYAPPFTSKLCISEDGTIYFHDGTTLYAIGPGGSAETHQASGYVKDPEGNGIAGVCVAITGEEAVLTDSAGYWQCDGLADGAYAIAPILPGYSFTPELATLDIAGQDAVVPDFVAQPAAAIWPMEGNNGQHTRRSTAAGPATPALSWSVSLTDPVYSEPVIAHEGSLVVYGNFKLHCYSPAGSERWTKSITEFSSYEAPAIGLDQKVYAAGSALYAYSSSGTLVWSNLPQGNAPVIAPDGGILQVSEGIRKLASDGALVWQVHPPDWRTPVTSPAVAHDGIVYSGNGKDALYAFSNAGDVLWRADAAPDTGSPYWQSTPSIGADGSVYLGSGLNFYAFSPDGAQQWVYPNDTPVTTSPAIGADGTVYFAKGDIGTVETNKLIALNPDGTLKWEYYADGYAFTSPPTVDGAGTVYIGIVGALHAVNPDGTRKWSFDDPPGDVAGAAIGADGTLYFGDAAGGVYALGPGAG